MKPNKFEDDIMKRDEKTDKKIEDMQNRLEDRQKEMDKAIDAENAESEHRIEMMRAKYQNPTPEEQKKIDDFIVKEKERMAERSQRLTDRQDAEDRKIYNKKEKILEETKQRDAEDQLLQQQANEEHEAYYAGKISDRDEAAEKRENRLTRWLHDIDKIKNHFRDDLDAHDQEKFDELVGVPEPTGEDVQKMDELKAKIAARNERYAQSEAKEAARLEEHEAKVFDKVHEKDAEDVDKEKEWL